MRTTRFEPTPAWEHALAVLDCPCRLLLVAHDGERPVGWCRMFPTDTSGEAEVGIGLLPPYRDQGLGTCMLRQAIGWAREQNLARLTLITRDDNHRAIHVFEKCGFSPTGKSEGKWFEMENPLHTIEARRHLCEQ
jgi:RimJ/RimL family protein N-acetyltransferase